MSNVAILKMNDHQKVTPLMIYHYIYQACIRWQVAFGATRGKYVEFKAGLPLMALQVWWVMILAAWTQISLGYDWFFSKPLVIILTVGALTFGEVRCLSSKETLRFYEEKFRTWPKKKRLTWDMGTATFLIFTPFLTLYSLYRLKTSGLWHAQY